MAEQGTHKPLVGGSSPPLATVHPSGLVGFYPTDNLRSLPTVAQNRQVPPFLGRLFSLREKV